MIDLAVFFRRMRERYGVAGTLFAAANAGIVIAMPLRLARRGADGLGTPALFAISLAVVMFMLYGVNKD